MELIIIDLFDFFSPKKLQKWPSSRLNISNCYNLLDKFM